MAKRKKFKIKYKLKVIHLFFFAIVVFILSLLATRNKSLSQRINLPSNKQKQSSALAVKRIEISGVKVADFISGTNQGESPSYYTIAKSADYHIFFLPTDEVFFISITSYPFDEHRGVAEQKLLEILAITKNDACKLNVDITTPAYANPDKAGEVYNLSFCSNNN